MQRNALRFRCGLLLADVAVLTLGLLLAIALTSGFRVVTFDTRQTLDYLPILLTSLVGWTGISVHLGLSGLQRGWSWSKVCSEIAVGVSMLVVLVSATAFLTRDYIPRLFLLYFALALLFGFALVRAALYSQSGTRWRRPNRRVIVLGTGRVAQEIAYKLQRHSEMRCEVVGFLSPQMVQPDSTVDWGFGRVSISPLDAIQFMREKRTTDIVVALSGEPIPAGLSGFVAHTRTAGIRVSLVPHLYELYASRTFLLDVDGLPLVVLRDTQPSWWASLAKRTLDLSTALILSPLCLVVLAPFLLYLRIVRRKALSAEVRCGKGGVHFRLYRLCIDRNAPDLSCVERMLDSFSVTELPQLWNVIIGDMSIVGPRPESPERVRHYSEWQRRRLLVHPGLTGLAQVHGLRHHNSSEEKANFDLQYIASWNLVSDTVLIVQTVWTLAGRVFRSKHSSKQGCEENMTRRPGLSSC